MKHKTYRNSSSLRVYSIINKSNSSHLTMIFVYVEDLVLEGSDVDEIINIKTLLNDKFNIKYLRVLNYVLSFEVLDQRRYHIVSKKIHIRSLTRYMLN